MPKNDFHAISLTDFLPIVNALEVEKSAVRFFGLRGINFCLFSQIIDMKRVRVFEGFKTRDERESCFPSPSAPEGRNVSDGNFPAGGGK